MNDLFQSLANFLMPWPGMFATDFSRYLVAALLVTLIVAVITRRVRALRAVRTRTPEVNQRRREFAYSVLSAAIFGLIGITVFRTDHTGAMHHDEGFGGSGGLYWVLSLALIIVAHDAYFYWTHRLMHHRLAFRWTHRTHHRSVAPTQWAAYSFAPLEAVVQGMFIPIYLIFVPTPISVIIVWGIHQVVRNAFGHSGVEFEPRAWLKGFWGRHLTTTLHHDMHHAYGRHNFGLYFTWWDRWCGTEHPEYRARLQALIERMGSNEVGVEAKSVRAVQ